MSWQHILPGQSARDLLKTVRSIQRNAGTLGAIGFIGIVWTALGFYSALESALNIVFGVQNRGFLHQKWVTFVLVAALAGSCCSRRLIVTTAATGWSTATCRHLIDLRARPLHRDSRGARASASSCS